MAIVNGTFNQIVKGSSKFGGTKVVFEGKPELLVGGFNFNLDDLPEPGEVLPCGTPVYCDEQARIITPILTARVASIDTTKKTITFEDNGFGRVPFKVGDVITILSDFTTAATAYSTITAIEGNVVTLDDNLAGGAPTQVLVKINSTNHKVPATPNALTPYDIVRSADAISVDGDGMWANDRPILERRMPAVTDAVKNALKAAGCVFKWSNRK